MISKTATALALSSLLWIHSAAAEQIDCTPHPTLTGDKGVVNVSGTISAGEDLAVGTEIYRFNYKSQNGSVIDCISPISSWGDTGHGSIQFRTELSPSGAPAPVNGITGPKNAPVYPTNVPGVGVYFNGGKSTPIAALPWIHPYSPTIVPGDLNHPSRPYIPNQHSLTVGLVKTGPIGYGAVSGSSFPSFKVTILEPTQYPQHSFSGLPVDTSLIQFSGQIQILKTTCTIKDKNAVVQLGSHDVSTLSGVNSTLPWVDASIELVNCEGFIGRLDPSGYIPNISGPGALPTAQTDHLNTMAINVTSASGLISQADGIIDITPGATSASGVGIQIGYESQPNSGVKLNMPLNNVISNFAQPGLNATSLKIPLFARYIQTENTVSAGRADGAIVYNITYY